MELPKGIEKLLNKSQDLNSQALHNADGDDHGHENVEAVSKSVRSLMTAPTRKAKGEH